MTMMVQTSTDDAPELLARIEQRRTNGLDEKLPFYARSGVSEYIEIDLDHRTVQLLHNRDGGWTAIDRSTVIDLSVDEVLTLLPE